MATDFDFVDIVLPPFKKKIRYFNGLLILLSNFNNPSWLSIIISFNNYRR